MGSKFKKSNSSSRSSVDSGIRQEKRMYQSIDYEKIPVPKDERVYYNGRSSRAYKTSGFSTSNTWDAIPFMVHESMENSLDRLHDKDLNALDKGLTLDPVNPDRYVGLEFVSPLSAVSSLLSRVSNGAGHALSSIGKAIGDFFSVKEKVMSDERRHYSSLKYENKKNKRAYRAKAFGDVLNIANRSADRRHQRKMVKTTAKQQRRTIAMKRGYW